MFFSTVDASIVSTALVTIGEYFDDFVKVIRTALEKASITDFRQTIWIAMSYLLAYMGILARQSQESGLTYAAAFSILWARLSDLVGRKWVLRRTPHFMRLSDRF